MKSEIAQQLLKNGILQFGIFGIHDTHIPYRLRLEMLPTYPQLFKQVMKAVMTILPDKHFDRLIAHADSVAIGSAIAQELGIPLVYSRGRGETPVYDLVGAYDVGHPSCLIVNTIDKDLSDFIAGCQRVGLDIHNVITLVASDNQVAGIPIVSLYTMEQIVTDLFNQQQITQYQMQVVLDYLAAEKKSLNQTTER